MPKTPSTRSATVLDRIDRRSNFGLSLSSAGFSKDGKWLAISTFKAVRVWGTATWKEVVTFKDFPAKVNCVAFSPDGKTLAVCGSGPARLYDTAKWKVRRELPHFSGGMHWLAFSPDGRTIVTAEGAGWLRFWDPDAGKERSRFLWPDIMLYKVAFTPDGKTLAGAGRSIGLYDLESKKIRATLQEQQKIIRAFTLSSDGKTLATTVGLEAREVALWDVAAGEFKGRLSLVKALDKPRAAAFSPDGKTLVVVGESPSVFFFDVASGEEWARLQSMGTSYECVAFSLDGRTLVTGCKNGTTKVWDVPKRKVDPPPQ